jgi:hypothetical protein
MALWGVQGSMQLSLFVIVLAFPRRRCPSRLHCCRLLSPGFVFCPAVLRFRLRTRVSLLSCALYSHYRSSAVAHQRRAALHRDLQVSQVACGGAELPCGARGMLADDADAIAAFQQIVATNCSVDSMRREFALLLLNRQCENAPAMFEMFADDLCHQVRSDLHEHCMISRHHREI